MAVIGSERRTSRRGRERRERCVGMEERTERSWDLTRVIVAEVGRVEGEEGRKEEGKSKCSSRSSRRRRKDSSM